MLKLVNTYLVAENLLLDYYQSVHLNQSCFDIHRLNENRRARSTGTKVQTCSEFWYVLQILMLNIRLDSTTTGRDWKEHSSTFIGFIQRRVFVFQTAGKTSEPQHRPNLENRPAQHMVSNHDVNPSNLCKCYGCLNHHSQYQYRELYMNEMEMEVRLSSPAIPKIYLQETPK